MRGSTTGARWLLLLGLSLAPSGCFLLGAGAGAGAAISLSDHGASSLVQAPIDEVADRTREVFQEMRIELVDEESAEAGGDLEFKGKNGSLDITVDLERREPGLTLVEVSAQESPVTWSRDYAKMVLERIVEKR